MAEQKKYTTFERNANCVYIGVTDRIGFKIMAESESRRDALLIVNALNEKDERDRVGREAREAEVRDSLETEGQGDIEVDRDLFATLPEFIPAVPLGGGQ